MKRKIITLALSISVAFSSLIFITSCGHEHTFSDAWASDASGHWHPASCDHSDEKSEFAAHIGAADDCKCDICEFETHTFDGTYHYNDSEHWLVASCGNVNHKKDSAAHVDENNDCKCDVCGRGDAAGEHPDADADCICDDCSELTHTFGGKYYYDENGHWYICSNGNAEHKDEVTAHNGMNDCDCDDCDYVKHKFSSEYSYNETHHWYDATCSHKGEQSAYEKHELDENGDCRECNYIDPDNKPVELPAIPA